MTVRHKFDNGIPLYCYNQDDTIPLEMRIKCRSVLPDTSIGPYLEIFAHVGEGTNQLFNDSR